MRSTIHKQNSLIARYCLAAVVLLALLGPLPGESRGDFVLQGDEQLTVSSPHNQGILFDRSRVLIVSGGSVNVLGAYGLSTVSISGGSVYGTLSAYDSSTVNTAGSIGRLNAYHSGAVGVFGGSISSLYAYDSSTVNISGGSVSGSLNAKNSSAVNISAGYVRNSLLAYDSSAVAISGGTMSNLYAMNSSAVAISGGSVANLNAADSSTVAISAGVCERRPLGHRLERSGRLRRLYGQPLRPQLQCGYLLRAELPCPRWSCFRR